MGVLWYIDTHCIDFGPPLNYRLRAWVLLDILGAPQGSIRHITTGRKLEFNLSTKSSEKEGFCLLTLGKTPRAGGLCSVTEHSHPEEGRARKPVDLKLTFPKPIGS